MKEFIEKLIGRLEEEKYTKAELFTYDEEDMGKMIFRNNGINKAIEIVNELAEEYEREHIVDLCNQFCDKADEILRKKTNAMKIRAMSDKELAEFLSETELHGSQGNYEDYLKFLQSEAE